MISFPLAAEFLFFQGRKTPAAQLALLVLSGPQRRGYEERLSQTEPRPGLLLGRASPAFPGRHAQGPLPSLGGGADVGLAQALGRFPLSLPYPHPGSLRSAIGQGGGHREKTQVRLLLAEATVCQHAYRGRTGLADAHSMAGEVVLVPIVPAQSTTQKNYNSQERRQHFSSLACKAPSLKKPTYPAPRPLLPRKPQPKQVQRMHAAQNRGFGKAGQEGGWKVISSSSSPLHLIATPNPLQQPCSFLVQRQATRLIANSLYFLPSRIW